MQLDRTATVLDIISTQRNNGTLLSALDSFLAQYVAVILYSEMEEKISELIQKKLSEHTNQTIATFLNSNMQGIIKRTSKADIAKFVAMFDSNFKTDFNSMITDVTAARYQNAIQARHDAAHGKGSGVTLSDLELGLRAANEILLALDACFPPTL